MKRIVAVAALAAFLFAVACSADDTVGGGVSDERGPTVRRNSPAAEGARRLEVQGRSFEFEPDEIRAEVGENLTIVLTSEDVSHDFVIDEFEGRVEALAGDSAEGGFRAERAGTFRFYCSIGDHRAKGMVGTLVVEG